MRQRYLKKSDLGNMRSEKFAIAVGFFGAMDGVMECSVDFFDTSCHNL
jgi:hypothetical protein